MRAARTAGAIALLAALAAGCGSGSGSGGDASGPTTTTAAEAGACSSYTPGKGGVVQVFCDGSGTVTVSAGGKDFTVDGATCEVSGGFFTINGGVLVGNDFDGTKPDYVGLNLPQQGGAFSNVALGITVGGTGYALTKNSGTFDAAAKTGTFTGTNLADDAEVTGSFTC